jgi:hypothetical protein
MTFHNGASYLIIYYIMFIAHGVHENIYVCNIPQYLWKTDESIFVW